MMSSQNIPGASAAAGSTETVRGVECYVGNCYYNKNNQICTAGQIKVGPTNASSSHDTNCATFRPR